MKKQLAEILAKRIVDGETVGLGSGSTVELAVLALGKRVAEENLRLKAYPTSHRIALIAEQAGIELLSPVSEASISWTFDGADEVDPELNLIKGGGAAMLNEKIIADRSERLVILVTEEKLVKRLGEKFAVPIEVIPEAFGYVKSQLLKLGAKEVVLRQAVNKYGPVISEHNNFILDAKFENIQESLEREINCITGVVDNGLFMNRADEVIVAKATGIYSMKRKNGSVVTEKV